MVEKRDAWMAMRLTIMKKLEYPLPALTLSEEDCEYIMAPILTTGLPKAGICKSLPRSLLYGNIEHQGLGLDNLYVTMGMSQLVLLLDHTWKKSITGKLMRISMSSLKLELGLNGKLFSHDFQRYHHLCTNCWMKHIWSFMCNNSIEIDDDIEDFHLLRENDCLLTEKLANAVNEGLITIAEWEVANRCRIFKKVISVADLASGDGYTLDLMALDESNGQVGRCRDLNWPVQGEPKAGEWKIWRKAIIAACCKGGTKSLEFPVGN